VYEKEDQGWLVRWRKKDKGKGRRVKVNGNKGFTLEGTLRDRRQSKTSNKIACKEVHFSIVGKQRDQEARRASKLEGEEAYARDAGE